MPDHNFSSSESEGLFPLQMIQFLDATTDAVLFLNRDYIITFLNRRARELLSRGEDSLGTNIFESYPGIVYEGSPYIEHYRRSMDLGLSGDFEAYYPEPLNFWLRIQSYPADGGIMVFFRDITEEKLAAEALRRKSEEAERQRAEIETVYRTAPIGLAMFDAKEFRYLRLNNKQAAFFGLTPEEILGQTLTQLAPIEGLLELFQQVLRGEPVINYPLEGTLATDPGSHRYWLVSYFPVFGPDGSVEAITAASLEITQQKKAEQALLQSEKLAVVGRLASSIAHEINNPLESVTNLLYLAQHGDDLPSVRGYLQAAERELRRVAAITSQTLRFHKQASSPQEVTAAELFESVLSVQHGRILNSGVEIIERTHEQRPVRCFEGEIRQVVSNLVSNALDAMSPTGGRLFLRSREGTNWSNGGPGIVFTIADTGSGMSAETLAKLFSPFFTTKGITGTGLGLWVSREIIDRHGGLLRVRSSQQPLHHGTVFTMFLPFAAVLR